MVLKLFCTNSIAQLGSSYILNTADACKHWFLGNSFHRRRRGWSIVPSLFSFGILIFDRTDFYETPLTEEEGVKAFSTGFHPKFWYLIEVTFRKPLSQKKKVLKHFPRAFADPLALPAPLSRLEDTENSRTYHVENIIILLSFVDFLICIKYCTIYISPFVSSVRSSYTDDGLLYIRGSQFFRFSLSPLIQLMLQVSL